MENFDDYCNSKKINALAFKNSETTQYEALKFVFEQVSVASFEQQKLFLINKIRRKYTLNA